MKIVSLFPAIHPRRARASVVSLLLAGGLFYFCGDARGALLDWSSVAAPTLPGIPPDGGSTTASTVYTNVNTGGYYPVDVTVTYTAFDGGAGAFESIDTPALLFERVSTSEWGARTRYNPSSANQFIRHTVTFSAPVFNVTFSIWDVDRGSWQDELRNISATLAAGGTTDPSSVTTAATDITITFVPGPGYTVTADAGADNPPSTEASADVQIQFSSPITSFQFDYGNGAAVGGGNPNAQLIYFSGIDFVPLPEVGVGFGAMAAGLLGIAATRNRRRQLKAPGCC